MKELCIVFDKKLNLKLDEIVNKLKQLNCIIIKLNEQNVIRLVIAYKETNSYKIENLIKSFLTKKVLKTFKQNYIKNNMKLNKDFKNKLLFSSLVNYDFETDKSYFFNKLEFVKDLYISSFINFKMQILLNKWKDIVNLTKSNIEILDCETVYYSLLRYLNENGLNSEKSITASILKNNLIEYNNKIFKIKDFLCYCNSIYPKKIIIRSNLRDFNYKEIILKLFGKKIDLIFINQLTTKQNNCTI